jgi:hypothetical protein
MVERDRLILPAELTKGRMSRAPDIPRPVVADLGRWRLACGGLGGLVFPRPSDGGRWTKTDWDNWRKRGFKEAAGAAGLLDWDAEAETWVGDFRHYDPRHDLGGSGWRFSGASAGNEALAQSARSEPT